MSPNVLVIGAAGFIGGWVTEALCAADFGEVRAAVRSSGFPRLSKLPVTIINCDIMKLETLETAMRDVSVVVNCVRDPSNSNLIIQGTEKLLSAAAQCGVSKVIQMSSVAVYGNAGGLVTEDTTAVGPLSRYATDNWAAEQLCRSTAGPNMKVAVVRPSLVYGPFGIEWSLRFIKGIASGHLGRLGDAGEGQANLIYAGDLGKFAAHLAVTALPQFSIYNANGCEIPTFNEYFERLSLALDLGSLPIRKKEIFDFGLRQHTRRLGRLVLRSQSGRFRKSAQTNAFISSSLKRAEEAFRQRVLDGPPNQYSRRVVYANERARQIGFVPPTALQQGIYSSVLWARSQGHI